MYILLLFLLPIIITFLYLFLYSDSYCSRRFHKLKSNAVYTELIANYAHLNKCTPDKVVISFTTTPERIENIQPMLNSILDQTVKVDQIALNIPGDLNCEIPKTCDDICNVYKAGKDYGIGTKFVPTLLRELDCGTKIILVKDNRVYGEDFVETMLRESDKHPEKCIHTGPKLEGSDGILIKPEFFKDVIHQACDDKWLESNIVVSKKNISYNKNKKY